MFTKIKLLSGLLLSLLFAQPLYAQQDSNLFSNPNSLAFAEYLVNSGQYDFALLELERVLLQQPGNDSIQASILYVYDLKKDFSGGIRRAKIWSGFSPEKLGPKASWEYLKLTLHQRDFEAAARFSASRFGNDEGVAAKTQAATLLLSDEYKAAQRYIDTATAFRTMPDKAQWLNLAYEGRQIRHKSPALAVALSVPVPGLGRIYAGSWKDGLFSMALVGGLGYQTYKAFHRDGINSVAGWIFGAATTAFYGGNLYGSFRAATLFNQRHRKEYRKKVEESLLFHP